MPGTTAHARGDGRSRGDARANLDRPIAVRFTTTQAERLFELAAEREVSRSTILREAADNLVASSR